MKLNSRIGGVLAVLGFTATLIAQPQPGAVLWKYAAGDFISSSPALAPDGTVYVGVGLSLCAITNSGSTASNKWAIPMRLEKPAAIGTDGTIYCANGDLYAINADGTPKWTFPGGGGGPCSPAIGSDNTIYFCSGAQIYAVSPAGTQKWTFPLVDSSRNSPSPVIGADGTIYVDSALTPQGSQKWVTGLPASGIDSPAIGGGGAIYYTASSLWAFGADGTRLWSTGNYVFNSTPVVAKDGTIYAQSYHVLYAVTPAGKFAWHVLGTTSARVGYTTPAIDAGGRIYFCVSNSVWALNPQGETLWTVTQPGDPGPGSDFATTSPIIGPDGTLYAALGPTLYAIATGTNGPAVSPWPMSRQNARNTGKVEKPSLKPPKKRADANFDLQLFPNQLGLTYVVENSSNLVDWTALTNFVATNSPVEVPDLTATNAPTRFYRAFSYP